jgi:hypothetical protein
VERSYDIFERMPDGALLWVTAVAGRNEALLKLQWCGKQRSNEFRLMHLPTSTVIAAINVSEQSAQ